MKVNRKHLGFLFFGLIIGSIFGYVIPFILPRKTIFERLSASDVPFSEKSWYEDDLQRAQYIQQVKNFESVPRIYEEKQDPLYSEPTDVVYVFVDSGWNVVWIEVLKEGTNNIKYIGFHFYSDPD